MQRHEEERGNQNRHARAMELLDRALHVATKAGLFANPRRGCGDYNCDPLQRPGGNERKIITLPERSRRKGDQAEQQNNRGVNRRGEEERRDHGPKPLRGRQPAATERLGAGGVRSAWGTSSARPPEIEREEYRLSDRSERHAKV